MEKKKEEKLKGVLQDVDVCMSGSEEGNWSKKLIMYIIGFVGFEDETSSFSKIDAFFIQFLKGWHTYHQCFRLYYHFMQPGEEIFV